MEAEIYRSIDNFWYGRVYSDSWMFGPEEGWRTVTHGCFTRFGAELALKNYVRKHTVYEVDI